MSKRCKMHKLEQGRAWQGRAGQEQRMDNDSLPALSARSLANAPVLICSTNSKHE